MSSPKPATKSVSERVGAWFGEVLQSASELIDTAKLALAKSKYNSDRKALEDGDLKRVPDAAPKGLEGPHGAVGAAKAKLPADPQSIEECNAATVALGELTQRVAEYLDAEAKALAAAKQKYQS